MSEPTGLQALSDRLAAFVEVLRLDTRSPWANKFERDLALSRLLLSGKPSRQDVIDLSKSVTDVFRGMGSFSDYYPGTFDSRTGRYTAIPGTEQFEHLANEVFDAAMALREIRG